MSKATEIEWAALRLPARDDGLPLVVLDVDGRICDCNQAAEELFGYASADMEGHAAGLLLPQLQTRRFLDRGLPTAELRFLSAVGGRFEAVSRDGRRFPCELAFNTLSRPPVLRVFVRPV